MTRPALLLLRLVLAGAPFGSPALEVTGCATLEPAALARFVAAELGGAAPASSGVQPRVQIRCEGSWAELHRPGIGAASPTTRTIDLGSSPAVAHPRIVAVALAELLRWPAATAAARPAPPAPPPPAAAVRTSPPVRPSYHPQLFAQAHGLFRGTGPLWGGGVRITRARGALLAAADLQAARGTRTLPLADLATSCASAGIAAGWTHAWRALQVGAALGARGGLARVSGTPRREGLREGAVTGRWAGPFSALGLGLRTTAATVELRVEAGRLLRAIDASIADVERVAFGGTWLAVGLAVGPR